jgi:hypothetical protein
VQLRVVNALGAGGVQAGSVVSLSTDGAVVAVGIPYDGGNGTNAGTVRVYIWNGAAWTQRGGTCEHKKRTRPLAVA